MNKVTVTGFDTSGSLFQYEYDFRDYSTSTEMDRFLIEALGIQNNDPKPPPNSIQCSSCKSHLSTLGLIGLDMTCDYCGRLNTIEL